MSQYFSTAVNSLDITENKSLLTETEHLVDQVEIVIKKFENYPSVLSIKEIITVNELFRFSEITSEEILSEFSNLDNKKVGSYKNIPTKILKQSSEISCEYLTKIWNEQVIMQDFPNELKLADITPILKKDNSTLAKKYRTVSVLPCISKIFERIMQKQLFQYIEKILSPFLCGYRKGFSTQTALLGLAEKYKASLDKKGHAGAVLMDLSKAFDTINHELLLAKLNADGLIKMN